MKTNWTKVANIFRFIARYLLLILGILVFLFALLSGSEGYGGGIRGIIKNSPNAIPWAILLFIVLVAWKRELIGGIIIVALGIAMFYFFNFGVFNFFLITYFLTIIITILGSFFIVSWLLRRNPEQTTAGRVLRNPRNLLLFYSAIIVICLTIAGLYGINRYVKFNTPPEKTSILQPKDGEQVDRQIFTMGGFTQADSLKELWLVVQPADSILYHPQQPLQKPPRRLWWHTTAYFGEPDDAPGKRYHVYLFSATEKANKVIKDYITESGKSGLWPGLKALPDGLMPLDTVTVVRK